MYYTCIYIYVIIYIHTFEAIPWLHLSWSPFVFPEAAIVNEAAPKDFNATAPVPNQHLGYVYTSEIEPWELPF